MIKTLDELDEDDRSLVEAAQTAMENVQLRIGRHRPDDQAVAATAAVLRKLSELMRPGWENDSSWPDPDDLDAIADGMDGGAA